MDKLGLTKEEENELKTINEYLFLDQFNDYVTYNRFEQCFQPLFNNIPISIYKVFKSIAGEKKKYINYKRLLNSYLLYKRNDPKIVPELNTFFEKLLKSILKKEKTFIGNPQEKESYILATPKNCKKREFISAIKLLSDKAGAIHGLIMEYDGIVNVNMFPSEIENDLLISLEMKLGIIDDKPIKEKQVGKLKGIKEEFYRDSVTHIFGTISQETKLINFLGFKCVSGKTVFVGFPEGDGFLFGNFGKKFHYLKVQTTLDGINLLQPGFISNIRTNYYLDKKANTLTEEDLKNDILIQDEVQLSQLNDQIEIDKMITTPIIDENQFLDEKVMDDIRGNDYKEVVNQNPREWILKTTDKVEDTAIKSLLTLENALEEVEKEKDNSKKLLNNGFNEEIKLDNEEKKKLNISMTKNQREKTGKLYKTKTLNENQIPKFNGDFKQIKKIEPINFLKDKDNYKKLSLSLYQRVKDEITNLSNSFNSNIAQSLIEYFKSNKKISYKNKNQIFKRAKTVTNLETGNDFDFFYSDAQQIVNAVEDISNYPENLNISKYFIEEKKKLRSKKLGDPQATWLLFGKKSIIFSRVSLLKSIGYILKIVNSLVNEIDGKKIPLEEKIKYLNFLNENENVFSFIEQKKGDSYMDAISTKNKAKQEKDEEENILMPSNHPEKISSLPELEKKMTQINKLLDNTNLKPEDKKKLKKLSHLYFQQKNILIENKTELAKIEIINQKKIDVNKLIEIEQEKRKKEKEEIQIKIEEEIEKEQGEEKIETSISKMIPPNTKIFRNQEIYKGEEPWTDPLFKPEKATLCPFKKILGLWDSWLLPREALLSDVDGWDEFKWCRVEEIIDSKNYSLFEDRIEIEDIIQGKICDCYFLSVLGSLCKFPELIENLFYTKEPTKEHIYGVYFYINGQKKLVLIDDFLPYVGIGFKKFAMSKSGNNKIWVSLIEKAWAKINGNYIQIGMGGTANEVFDVLTEAFSEEVKLKSVVKEELWQKLIDGEKKGFVMTAGTSTNDNVEDEGLKGGHAYSVLGVYEIKGERVLRLRNPWGEGEFYGDWSDDSSKWTDELREKYEYYEKEDGDFFIGYKDFLKYFVKIGFAKLHRKWSSSKLKIKKTEAIKCQLIKVTIPQDNTLVYFQFYGKNPRIPNKNGEYPKTVLSSIILANQFFQYLDSSAGNSMHICVERTLDKGTYYLFCDTNYRFNKGMKIHGYTITAYSGIDILMENVTEKNPVPYLIRKVAKNYCINKGKPYPQENGVNLYITKSFNEDLPFKILVFQNTTNYDYTVKLGLEYKKSKSCSFYCDDIAEENDTIVVKNLNLQEEIVIIIMYHNLSSLFNFNCSIFSAESKIDPIFNHPVFEEKGYVLDDIGKLVEYCLEKGEGSYYIGLENNYKMNLEMKLVLEGLIVIDGPYKGQATPIFEIKTRERKVFHVFELQDYDGDISYKFDFNSNDLIAKEKEKKDPIFNHPVFNEEGEPIDEEGRFFHYSLDQGGGSYIIGVENKSLINIKLKLILEGLIVNDGPCKGQTLEIFELNKKERKIFNVLEIKDYPHDSGFSFDFA